ncbi:MAG TPA: alpha/beta hydrolase family protein [archaeon]|nr:alpha/beta hydrolase family protein [archaeon]
MKALKCMVSMLIFAGAALWAAGEPPSDAFTVLRNPPKPGRQVTPYLSCLVETAWKQDEIRKSRLATVRTESEFIQLQREIRQNLLEIIGGLPEKKTPLNPRISGRIQMEGYRIEKVVFESLPGFHVTALLYLPDGPVVPKPAVLVACGHSSIGKAYTSYQQISARLAKRGYVALCWDPVGQGERSQFWDEARGESRYNRVCGEHAVFGNLAYLAGANLARWEIWDGIRALDYLLTRPEVDSTRISVTGTSGGGFQSAHIGALDTRIGVVAPSCYISSLPMRMFNRIFADPDSDPEQDLYRMVSAGIDHPGLLMLVYPRPLIVCAAVEDFFPIEGTRKTFREAADIYRMFQLPERIALTEGYHQHSFSNHNQEFAFAFLDRFNHLPVRQELDSTKVLEEKALWCTSSGQVRLDYKDGKSLMQLVKEYYLERKNNCSLSLPKLYHGDFYPGIENWPVVPYEGKPVQARIAWEAVGSIKAEGFSVDRYLIHHSGQLTLPLVQIHSQDKPAGKTLLWFNSNGKASDRDWPELKSHLEAGYQVISFDFRGLGENRMLYQVSSIDDPSLARVPFETQYKSPLSGVLANYIYNSLLVGRPYFLQMIEDAEIAARFATVKLASGGLWVTASGEAYTLASCIAEALPGVSLLPGKQEKAELIKWSEIVQEMRESWPIEFLLPGGAYVH